MNPGDRARATNDGLTWDFGIFLGGNEVLNINTKIIYTYTTVLPADAPPTRITAPPWRVESKKIHKRITTFVLCDDGKTYSVPELAKLKKLKTSGGLLQRIKAKGWQYEYILAPAAKKGYNLDGTKTACCTHTDRGNAEWQALGSKPRSHNLAKITATSYTLVDPTVLTYQPNGDAL